MHPSQSPFSPDHVPPPYLGESIVPPAQLGPRSVPVPVPITDTRARTAGIALLVAGALLLVGIVARSWFSARGGSIGLLGVEECRRGICQSLTWLDINRAPTELKLFASVGLLGALAAIGFLIHSATMLLKQQPKRVMFKALNGTLAIAAVGCFGFFFHLAFGEMAKRLSISWAGFFAMGGLLAASVIAASLVRPLMRVSK
ncbi:MAG: hypothetical protein H0T89_31545 [Deltaproteobacteria bacterium]|nr:hypothetical protein [Deltaproteobacteria bacterium]MDQ3300250.1 hypothetical protein [Myxococcota bacterium]